ncbi:twin-arginine translocase TatA/TatE family subunit [Tichowtungia aerotolerans]|uniref:Sec-independent protein translocase protein TatA n=1 Tax=Tichowtungia aerotolerans TaxID=2697043 RepID=A0A6P1M5G3_9BACT|nr:twin-arginine translocase TatA/TatE family subunit [Tichowtungia aerotolerans]QHI69081.1 twin-arginine translocase TatA/TatE family subunit [Tichowtungia aerotolerans]
MNIFALIPGMQGAPEILLIVFVVILLFGGKKLPELARSLGKSINEFKRGQTESLPEKKEEDEKSEESEAEEKKSEQ